ncbi:acyl-[ACP]--phospholipid O-acyltransferase [Hydrogenimonas sp.]|uniref:acyl-[ACP]--phospholipid O-acyltransferase n=1 Tax=Hydrogenimonas sp. TaxID=2231112 RepID=UPI00261FA9E8|nr:acyl-[ACP]--phospholipid O-acyltransferase [Hydrogenimonas sp.]
MNRIWLLRGFLPFIFVLVFNAMTDIAHKITIQNVLIKSFEGDTLIVLSALVNALILIPFILLFSPSGFLSDRFHKTHIIRYAALASILLALLATISYYAGWFYFAFAMTFLLAVQSAIYSPAKYGLLKELVGSQRLAYANGIVQAATISAILGSALLFSLVFETLYDGTTTPGAILQSIAPLGWLLVAMTLFESWFAFRIPPSTINEDHLRFDLSDYFRLAYLKRNLTLLRSDRIIWISIIGLSLFWGVSQLVVAAFPAHYKTVTGDENTVIIQGILAVSAIGLIIGSIMAGRLSRRHIEFGIVPIGALGMFLSLTAFATAGSASVMAAASFSFGFFGGLVIVPFNATIQYLAPDHKMGTILAGNNFIQNIAMVLFLVATIALVQIGFSSYGIFHIAAWITLAGTIYAMLKMPQLVARLMLLPILHTRYRIFVEGLENLPQAGGVLLLGNHVSWIDWLILQVASPRAIKFVMEKRIYEQWYLKWFLKWFNVIPISGISGKGAIEQVRKRLDNGEVVALFPEGRISYNGQLGEFKKGFELIMKDAAHPIVPFYLHGLWGSTFSRAETRYKLLSKTGARRDIGVVFGKPLPSHTTAHALKQTIQTLSFKAWDRTVSRMEPLHIQWLGRAKGAPFRRAIVDAAGTDLTRVKMLSAVLLFAKVLEPRLKDQTNVGVLLPSSAAGAIVNMALFVLGKRPVNLNYTLPPEAMKAAVEKADLQTVVSSEKFLKKLAAKGFDPAKLLGERILHAETIGAALTKKEKTVTFLKALLFPARLLQALYFEPVSLDDTATILFSSGSEGTPKGIELTHRNLLGNIKQVSAMINFTDEDVILNSLPIFHSFGLTVTTLLPLCEGVLMASVPDPTDALSVGKMAARYRATILFGTSTFFRLYTRNRKLHPMMFGTLRMAVAGAEKLKPEIKTAFKTKFGVELYEGYGTTETSPVIAVNMPDALDPDTLQVIVGNKPGSVGQPLPGTVIRIVDPDTMEELPVGEDGLILVGGVQVMKGYLNDPGKTAEVLTKIDDIRFYKTGDKGHLDEDGFITIVDRYSRFAKIGGEMISLGSVEAEIERVFGEDFDAIAVNLPDEKKGELIVLLYSADMEPSEVMETIKSGGMASIMQPAKVFRIESLPKLASGKADFNGAKRVAQDLLAP